MERSCSELWVTEHTLLTASKPGNFQVDFAFLSCSAVCSAVPTVNIPKVFAINILILTYGGGKKQNRAISAKANKVQKVQETQKGYNSCNVSVTLLFSYLVLLAHTL